MHRPEDLVYFKLLLKRKITLKYLKNCKILRVNDKIIIFNINKMFLPIQSKIFNKLQFLKFLKIHHWMYYNVC